MAWFIEADNALGSRRGDVDDAFALAAVLGAGLQLAAIGSTYGNASEADAARNNAALVAAMGADARRVRGCARPRAQVAEAVDLLCRGGAASMLALGPLTTLAAALRRRPDLTFGEVVVVGGDGSSNGWAPPLWPYEFNLVKDRQASVRVLRAGLPLTFVPLDVGRRCLLPRDVVEALDGAAGDLLRRGSRRWFDRARRRFGVDAVRAYDLLAVAAVLRPELVQREATTMQPLPWGGVRFRRGHLRATIVVDFDRTGIHELLRAAVAATPR